MRHRVSVAGESALGDEAETDRCDELGESGRIGLRIDRSHGLPPLDGHGKLISALSNSASRYLTWRRGTGGPPGVDITTTSRIRLR